MDSFFSKFSTTGSQNAWELVFSPIDNPKYFMGSLATAQPMINARLDTKSSLKLVPIITLLLRFTFNPETNSYCLSVLLTVHISSLSASQNDNVSLANYRCDTAKASLPTSNPLIRLLLLGLSIILLNPLATIVNKKRDRGDHLASNLLKQRTVLWGAIN